MATITRGVHVFLEGREAIHVVAAVQLPDGPFYDAPDAETVAVVARDELVTALAAAMQRISKQSEQVMMLVVADPPARTPDVDHPAAETASCAVQVHWMPERVLYGLFRRNAGELAPVDTLEAELTIAIESLAEQIVDDMLGMPTPKGQTSTKTTAKPKPKPKRKPKPTTKATRRRSRS